jgi:hypothetical protein
VSLRTYGFDEETEDLAAWLRDVGGPVGSGPAGGFGDSGELPGAGAPWGSIDPGVESLGATPNGDGHGLGAEGNGHLETGA